jgi:hypothetical protein
MRPNNKDIFVRHFPKFEIETPFVEHHPV